MFEHSQKRIQDPAASATSDPKPIRPLILFQSAAQHRDVCRVWTSMSEMHKRLWDKSIKVTRKLCVLVWCQSICSSTTSTLQRHERWTIFPYESTTLSPRLALLNPQRGVSVFALEVDSPSVVEPKRPTNPLTAMFNFLQASYQYRSRRLLLCRHVLVQACLEMICKGMRVCRCLRS